MVHLVTSTVDRAGFYLLACCVAFAPVPFGSNSDGFAGMLGLALSIALLGTLASPPPTDHGRRLCATALAIGALIALWSAIQVLPSGNTAWTHAIWKKVDGLTGDATGTIAVSRYQPLYSLGYVLLPLAAFVSALVYVRDSGRYMRFLQIVVGVSCIITVLCIGQYLYTPGTLLWTEKQHYLSSFTGSFINPNTAATYFGLLLLMALSAGLRQLERIGLLRLLLGRKDPTGSGDPSRWLYLIAYLAAALVFLVALMLTQSRAGIVSSMAGAACLIGAFAYFAVRRKTSVSAALGLSALVLLGAALLLGLYAERVMRRLQLEGLVDKLRACAFKSTWRAIEDHFWGGTGLGTFQDVFPHYRTADCGLEGHWNQAHNFFLEGLLSVGAVVFTACLLAVYLPLIAAYVRGVRERRRLRFVPLMCLCALVTLTLHSLVDFSLQIPALAVLASAILGAGAAISVGRSDRETRRRPQWLAPKTLPSGAGRPL
jgi:O-antigen ligase